MRSARLKRKEGSSRLPSSQECNGGAQSSGFRGRILPINNKWRAGEYYSNRFPLHADAFAVDDADGAKAGLLRFDQVFLNHLLHVTRRDGVQIYDIADFDLNRIRKWIERIDSGIVPSAPIGLARA